ncbi:MAG: hypothetical protein J7647_06065 [Cyanobacteria bacterium SBLK]|nr:hypothetical protein [Cyanobacteria bacterium SBLK]
MLQEKDSVANIVLEASEETSESERDRELGNIILEVYLAAMTRELDEIDEIWERQSQRYQFFRFNAEL